MRFRHGLLTAAAVLLAGCGQQATKPYTPPKVVYVTVTKYVAVPKEMTTHFKVELPQNHSVKEAVRVAKARRGTIEQCNLRLDAIRELAVPAPATSTNQP